MQQNNGIGGLDLGREDHVSLGRIRTEKENMFKEQMESLGLNSILAL